MILDQEKDRLVAAITMHGLTLSLHTGSPGPDGVDAPLSAAGYQNATIEADDFRRDGTGAMVATERAEFGTAGEDWPAATHVAYHRGSAAVAVSELNPPIAVSSGEQGVIEAASIRFAIE